MNLPTVMTALIEAQNSFDSAAYAACFSADAIVFDEGKTHHGREAIQHWIADANERYAAVMEPVKYEKNEGASILKAEVSGNFPGSPILLNYHMQIVNGLIQSLKITG